VRYTLLGRTGLRVSELWLGTMTFGEDWGWGAPKDACGRMLDIYADAGGNVIDTANRYTNGSSETILGELLEGRRDKFVLATKYTLNMDPADVNAAGNSRKNLVRSLDASLKRLRTDHVDILWVHARDTLTPVEEVMRALDDQVRLGKVLYVGVSDWPAWEVAQATTMAALRSWSPFVALQIQYNLAERTAERDLLPMAHALDLAVTAWGPLAAGILTGKFLAPGAEGRSSDREIDDRTRNIAQTVVEVAREIGAQPSQVALRWLLDRPGFVLPILGASKEDQLRDNLACLDVTLSDEHTARLNDVSSIELGFPHQFLYNTRDMVYGAKWPQIDDRRFTVRRSVADEGSRG
jgi:aryl-alcohol dehydrogenase-like predicted oxidoreductase